MHIFNIKSNKKLKFVSCLALQQGSLILKMMNTKLFFVFKFIDCLVLKVTYVHVYSVIYWLARWYIATQKRLVDEQHCYELNTKNKWVENRTA